MRCPTCLETGLPLVVEVNTPRTVRFAIADAVAVADGIKAPVRLFDSRSGEHWDVNMEVREDRAHAHRQFVDCPQCGPVDCEVVLPDSLYRPSHTFIINPEAGS
jgi:hypothetical protein